jgi:hypothetical protein
MHGNSLSDTASRACWKRRMSSAAGDGKDKDRDPVEVLTRWYRQTQQDAGIQSDDSQ